MSVESACASRMNSSAFLQGIHHAYAQVDGSYAWPNSREGDLLRAARAEIEALTKALANAEAACNESLACMTRWESGKSFDASGPEAAIKDQLYDVIRPGAREAIKKMNALLDAGKQD